MIYDAINDVLESLVDTLPARLRPYAKAIIPGLATLAATITLLIVEGHLTGPALRVAVTGFGSALLTALFPNRTARAAITDLPDQPSETPRLLPGDRPIEDLELHPSDPLIDPPLRPAGDAR
jgi:hypothetical protein